MACLVLFSFTFTACSDDDDTEGGGNVSNSVKFDNKTFKTPYAYWYMNKEAGESGSDNTVTMEFYSCNPTASSIPSSVSYVAIDYELEDGNKEINTTVVKSGNYHIYVAYNVTMSSEGIQCETEYGETGNSDLKIVRNGNTYTISIEHATVSDENKSYDFSFNYSGGLTHQIIK